MEFIIIVFVVLFVVLYRKSNGESLYKFVTTSIEMFMINMLHILLKLFVKNVKKWDLNIQKNNI